MDDKEIIKLARQCDLPCDQQTGEVLNFRNLVMFTKIVRFRERKQCGLPHKTLTDEQVQQIIRNNMILQMNLPGIRQDFEKAMGLEEENKQD